MAFDAHKNFAASSVAVAPSPATSGTSLTVATGEGARFPTPPFQATVAPAGLVPLPTTAEVVRVTAIAGDVFTITRAQEFSTARAIVVGDSIIATITAKALTDIETTPFARTDQANTFLANQEIQPALFLRNPGAPVNQRLWRLLSFTDGGLYVTGFSDDGVTPAGYVTLNRSGSLSVQGSVSELGRTNFMGYWTEVPFNASNFSGSGGMTWTVSAGNILANRYTLIGKTILWNLFVTGSTVGGTLSSALTVIVPVPFAAVYGSNPVARLINGTRLFGEVYYAGAGSVSIFRGDAINFTAGSLEVLFTAAFAIN